MTLTTGKDKTNRDNMKNKKLVNPSVVLDNVNRENGEWILQATLQTTNNNALQLHITNKAFDLEQIILLHNTSLTALCNFGEELCKLASKLIRQGAKSKK